MKKVNYVDKKTVITAKNLNNIQDAINNLEQMLISPSVKGAVANFPDGSAFPVKELIATIEPVQSGSGDPSPTNVRAINGTSVLKVSRTGKNLLPYPYYHGTETKSGVTFTDNGDGTVTVNGTNTSSSTVEHVFVAQGDGIVLPVGSYKISGCTGGSTTTYLIQWNPTGSGTFVVNQTNGDASLTLTQRTTMRLSIKVLSGATVNNVTFKPMIRLASDSATWESPVNNTVTSINLGQTVYGGTLNVTTGELTLTHRFIEYNGSESWGAIGVGYRISLGSDTGVGYSTNSISNWLTSAESGHNPTSATTATPMTFSCGSYMNINVSEISSITDVASLKTYLASNPLQICYELATPTTVQLSKAEITTLLGNNNIFTDSGDVEVTYIADTKLYIDSRL